MPGWLILILFFAALIYLAHPNRNRGKMRPWKKMSFAHRGLHDPDKGVVENTLAAFKAACDAGVGIEMDVQLTRDLVPVVFHDASLLRLCGIDRRIRDIPYSELQSLRLCNAPDAFIPTFEEVLTLIGGRVPLLVEIKNSRHNRYLCQRVMAALDAYRGSYIIESFNPLIVGWFRRHAPHVVRGQLVCPMREYIPTVDPISAFCMSGLLLNFISRPDFVAYNANAQRFFSPHFQRFFFRTPMAGWTIKSDSMAALMRKRGEMCIFERIMPKRTI